jgi:hypothetical protein
METAALVKLVTDIAFFLNEGEKSPLWVSGERDDTDRIRTIVGPKESKLYLQVAYGTRPADTHLSISGSTNIGKNGQYVEVYDRGADGKGWERQHVPDIRIAIAKGPHKIAQEIKRRLLPEYQRILKLAQKKVSDETYFHACRTANLTQLADIVHEGLRTDDRAYEQDRFHWYRTEGCYGEVYCNDKRADVKLQNLTIAQAAKLLELAEEWSKASRMAARIRQSLEAKAAKEA